MKSRVVLLFLLLLFFVPYVDAVAEEGSFRSGYVITNSNDTIWGVISCANINPYEKCMFRNNKNGEVTEFQPGEISSYRFFDDGKFFVSKEVSLKTGKRWLFLEYLIKGKASAFYFRDNYNHFFVETDKEPLLEISESDTIINAENGSAYYKNSTYKGKLRYLLSDCPELFSEINSTDLYSAELINLFKEYHEKICPNEQCVIFERKIPKVKIHFGISVGVGITDFRFNDNVFSDSRIQPVVGAQMEIENVFFNIEQSFLRIGVSIQKYSTFNFHNNYYLENGVMYYKLFNENVNLNTIDLRVPVSLNYRLSLNRLSPYFGAGVSNHIFITKNRGFFVNNYSQNLGTAFQTYYVGLLANVGVKYRLSKGNELQFELYYDYFQNPNVNKMLRMKNHTTALTFSYSF